MSIRPSRLPRTLVVVVIVVGLVSPVVNIQLRLWRNGKVADRLAESLHATFPGAKFSVAPSYEREVISITVLGGLRPEQMPDVEHSLRALKAEQHIAPAIWLRLPENDDGEDGWVKL